MLKESISLVLSLNNSKRRKYDFLISNNTMLVFLRFYDITAIAHMYQFQDHSAILRMVENKIIAIECGKENLRRNSTLKKKLPRQLH